MATKVRTKLTALREMTSFYGNWGRDILYGGAGADILIGGWDKDIQYAGEDSDVDTFIFNSQMDSGTGQ